MTILTIMGQGMAVLLFAYVAGMLYYGLYRNITARFQKRIGPPVLQTFYDSMKLLFKDEATAFGWMFYLGPVIMATGSVLTLLLLPFLRVWHEGSLSVYGDLFVILYLMVMGPLGNALAVGVSGNPFGVMGVTRGLTRLMGLELPFYIAVIGVMSVAQSSDIWHIIAWQQIHGINMIHYPLLFIAALFSFVGFMGSSPFDVVAAPQEVYSGPRSEFSGKFLGLLMSQNAIFGFAKLLLMVDLFWGGADSIVELILKTFTLFLVTIVIGVVYGRFKVHQAVDFLVKFPTLLGVVGLLLL